LSPGWVLDVCLMKWKSLTLNEAQPGSVIVIKTLESRIAKSVNYLSEFNQP